MSTQWMTAGNELAYIKQRAQALGIDPEAALAVAAHEGVTIPSEVGDQGTSFGPWQLHAVSGDLPASVWTHGPQYAEQWANSQQGIDYALSLIQQHAQGLTGTPAVEAIVGWEHNVPPQEAIIQYQTETQGAISTYQQGGGPQVNTGFINPNTGQPVSSSGSPVPSVYQKGASAVSGAVSSVAGSITGPITNTFDFLTSIRFAEIIGGALLLVVGLYIVAKNFGLKVPGGAVVSRLPGV